MRARAPHFCSALLVVHALALAGCKSDKVEPPAEPAAAASATSSPSAAPASSAASSPSSPSALDALSSCRATDSGKGKGVTWQCPDDVVALDMLSVAHDDAAAVSLNLDKFAEPFVGMGIARDDSPLTAGASRLRSVKLAGEKPGAGPIVARMAVVDQTPTRYVSCAAKRDACDPVLRALLGRTPGAH